MILPKPDQCGKKVPTWWDAAYGAFCVLPKGHPVDSHLDTSGVARYTRAHETESGRKWPIGQFNVEYL